MNYSAAIETGEKLFLDGQFDQAGAIFDYIIKQQPDNFAALNNLGVIHHHKGNRIKAEEYFLKAINSKEDYIDGCLNLIQLYIEAKRFSEACIYLEKCTEKNPNENLFKILSQLYYQQGNFQKAEYYCDRAKKSPVITESGTKPNQPEIQRQSKFDIKTNVRTLKILFVQEAPCIRNYKMAIALRSRGHIISLAYTSKCLSECYTGLSDDTYDQSIKLASYRHLWEITKNYDLVHCHNEPDTLTVAALAGYAPVIHDTHDLISLRDTHDSNTIYFEGIANRAAAGRIYSTPYQQEEAEKMYGVDRPSLIFYNYVSESDLSEIRLPKLSRNNNEVHVVYEGGIGGSAHRDFTDLFIELANNNIHIHVYPTSFNQELKQFFSKYPNIHYYQPVSPKQIVETMTQYDFGIIPFNIQNGNKRFLDSTIANKLFEYLAAGLPVITSQLKSYSDFFADNKVGITFETGEGIIKKIPVLKAIAETVDFSRQIYTYENEINRLEEFYYQLLESQDSLAVQPMVRVPSGDLIKNSWQKLVAWIKHNGWDGYDPYDIQDYFIQQQKMGRSIPIVKQNEIIRRSELDPIAVRKELKICKKRNAKALGLLMSSWVKFYKQTNNRKYIDEAIKISEWLLNNPSKGYLNYCWGYPFDWQSVKFIPKDTPSAVVSTVVGDGFWELYHVTNDKTYLNICISICRFITENLNSDDMGDDGICFSYTPIDDYHVHNANLFCGEFLARVGKIIENRDWLKLGEKTADYALNEQNPDGSIYYWGKIQNHYNANHLDHYHTGFEIRCLYELTEHLKLEKIHHAYKKYLDFYLKNYLLPDGTPKISPVAPYPVNIHGAAECILMLSRISKTNKDLLHLAKESLIWTIKNMQTSEGWFGHLWSPDHRVDAPYLRWGQAWMLRAIAEYLSACLASRTKVEKSRSHHELESPHKVNQNNGCKPCLFHLDNENPVMHEQKSFAISSKNTANKTKTEETRLFSTKFNKCKVNLTKNLVCVKKRKPKICHIGGAHSLHVADLVHELDKLGYPQCVISYFPEDQSITPPQVPVYFFPYRDYQNSDWERNDMESKLSKYLEQVFAKEKPNLIHGHSLTYSCIPTWLSKTRFGLPTAIFPWNMHTIKNPNKIVNYYEKLCLKNVDRVFHSLPNVFNKIQEFYGDIPDDKYVPFTGVALDYSHFSKERKISKMPRILSARMMGDVYRQDLLIKAMPELLSKFPDLRVTLLIGHNEIQGKPYFDKMIDLAKRLNVMEYCYFVPHSLGKKEFSDMIYDHNIIYSLASHDTGLSSTCVLSAFTGAITVVQNASEIKGILEHDTNVLLTDLDVNSIIRVISYAIENIENLQNRFIKNNRFLEKYSSKNQMDILEKVYAEMIKIKCKSQQVIVKI